jgi:hypothetical protein
LRWPGVSYDTLAIDLRSIAVLFLHGEHDVAPASVLRFERTHDLTSSTSASRMPFSASGSLTAGGWYRADRFDPVITGVIEVARMKYLRGRRTSRDTAAWFGWFAETVRD